MRDRDAPRPRGRGGGRRSQRGSRRARSIARRSPTELALRRGLRRARAIPSARCQGALVPGRIRVILDLGRDGRGSGKAVVFTESITTQEYLRKLLLDIGPRRRGRHPVSRHQRSRPRAAGARSLAGGEGAQSSAGHSTDARGRRPARAGSRVPHAVEGPRLHRSGREGAEPPVLRDGHQLRPAVEPAAHRAAHRPLPPVQPAARRHRRQLHRHGTTRRIA